MNQKVRVDVFKNLLCQCLAPSSEEILLIGDRGHGMNRTSVFMTEGFGLACEELGLHHKVLYQNTKTRGEEADIVVTKAIKSLPKESIIIINVSNRLGSMKALGHSFRTYAKHRLHRFTSASTLGPITPAMLPDVVGALDVDYLQLQRTSERVKKLLDNGSEVHLTSKGGTDCVFDITDMTGRVAAGVYTVPGTGGNLPGSEAYIAPKGKGVDGRIVIDGSARIRNGTRLITGQGIVLDVQHGEIVRMNKTVHAKELQNTLAWAHRKSEFPWGVRRIGELGIGTNPHAKIIGATILDEKVLGSAHVAIGSNKWFGGSVYSIIHLDQVMRDATIRIDGKLVKP